ncbi:hypothetical protein QQX98_000385 [Neonectria punicea]|uniref:Flavin reductase like domain-containing protein n=1 Tax=Neonectria punicea TaxID=979145 RepID=A0ABR1HT64_9HYPO
MSSETKLYSPRYPHFKEDEFKRPGWDSLSSFRYTKTLNPEWQYGDGGNGSDSGSASTKHECIDPFEEGRSSFLNYKLLTTAIVPRPIAFLSTRNKDGKLNIAPFSYFNYFNHDPPIFVVGFGTNTTKPNGYLQDTVRNIRETGECVLNIISESFIEAANTTGAAAPAEVSEWEISGLTPVFDCKTVSAPRVKEAIFSMEAKVDTMKEIMSRAVEGKISGTLGIFDGTRFWVREDAIDDAKSTVDPAILRPVGRYASIGYTRTIENFELPTPDFEIDIGGFKGINKIRMKKEANV